MNQKILFKYTSRSRPNSFFRGLDSIVLNLGNSSSYHILCTFDVDDIEYSSNSFLEKLKEYKNLTPIYGISTSKIDAINRDLSFSVFDFDILINMSDDFIFVRQGFDNIIREAFDTFAIDLDAFIHFHDGIQPRLATMSVIGKKWFDRTGYIYHPSYLTEWCDNEEQEKAKRLGKYYYMGDNVEIMKHINPYHGNPNILDELYKRNSQFVSKDKENYFQREQKNFPLSTWQILVASTLDRKDDYEKLIERFNKLITNAKLNEYVSVISDVDNKEKTIGKKRQDLLEKSTSDYICFFDDDDYPYDNYVVDIYKAILTGVDCVGIKINMTTDGDNPQTCCHSLRYPVWSSGKDGYDYLRNITQFNCVKKELALQVGYKDLRYGEDKIHSDELTLLCKTEYFIETPVFHYRYSTKLNHKEKYGIK